MYTVSEARKCLRLLLNECDKGNEVIIERYGEQYVLLARMGSASVKKHFDISAGQPKGTSAQSKNYKLSDKESNPKIIKTPAQAEEAVKLLRCKGEHYMSRQDCGLIGCPWA